MTSNQPPRKIEAMKLSDVLKSVECGELTADQAEAYIVEQKEKDSA